VASPLFGLSRRALSRFGIAGLAAASVFVLLPAATGTAAADPKVTAAAAAAELQTLNTKAEILSEKYDAGQDQLSAAQLALTADQRQIAAAQVQVDAARKVVSTIAVAAYTSGSLDNVASLIGESDPTVALQRAAILGLLTDHQNQTLRTATAADVRLEQAETSSKQQVASIAALQASLKSQQSVLDKMVVQQTALLKESQTQAQAQAAAAAQAAADAQARAAAATQEEQAAARVSRSVVRPAIPKAIVAAPKAKARAATPKKAVPVVAVPATSSSKAASVLKYAYAQLSKPYRYGAAGARTFDCSGLTMMAWRAAGVSLSHNAAAQYYSTPHVAKSKLQPGDLVYFGHPIHHVGIYIGGGKMIEAPYTGASVRVTSFGYRTDYAGASRP
jgi:cell wall-associated NlpC family hydrolase